MGKTVERIVQERGHTIAGVIDQEGFGYFTGNESDHIDAAIEFSTPETAFENVIECINRGIPVVSGTTGWLDKLDEVRIFCVSQKGAFLYASNFSIGVNLFFKVNKYLAKLIAPYQKDYTPSMAEAHHTSKKDAPSGTAITLAQDIIDAHPSLDGWVNEPSQQANQLGIVSQRVDPTPGTHTVNYQSAIDTLTLQHTAHSREGFAFGAVLAAEWIAGKQGVFTMDDLLAI